MDDRSADDDPSAVEPNEPGVPLDGEAGEGWDAAAFQAVFRESFDAMVVADDEGRYVEANPAACRLFGLPREDLLGRSIVDFAPEGFDFDGAWRSFAEGKNERGLFPLVRPDGERRVVEYSATREVLPGRHLSIMRDVTGRESNQRRLRRQRDELDTLNRINELVRETIDDVVDARTRGTIERTVCGKIAASDLYTFALVGERNRRQGGISVRTSVSVVEDWIDRVDNIEPGVADAGPGVEAIQTDAIQVFDESDLTSLPGPVGDVIRDAGARSLLVAPLSFGDVGYGFLAVGANRDGAFGEREVRGFSALANAIGFAINAVESKQSLSADATTVLVIDVVEPDSSLARLANSEGGTVEIGSMLPLESRSVLIYARVSEPRVAGERLTAEAGEDVERVRVVERFGGGNLLEIVQKRRTPVHVLLDLGARVRDVSVDADGTWHLVASLPADRDVRAVVDSLGETYPTVTLQSKGVDGDPSGSGAAVGPFERLTDRQRTVLEAAYQAGYYDWPTRGSSAEELAEAIGIAPQTLLEHLRKAERIVVDELFDVD